ncbi:MAG: hypothetical protein HY820_40630 [Acidobacteria bacterium]|nr:hypothetical protein [Acidobacteriota bacterium]
MRVNVLLLFLLIPAGAMAQMGMETNIFHASLPQLGVTIWAQTLRNMETGALVSGSLEARAGGIRVNKLEIRAGDGTTIFDFAISTRHARVSFGPEDEERLAAVGLLLEDPTQFHAVAEGQEAILERAETSVSLGALPFTDISLPGAAAFRVSGTVAVAVVRAPSGGAVLITCAIYSNDRQFISPGVGLYAADSLNGSSPLFRADDIRFGMSGSEKNVSLYAAIHETDASGRAALDGLFAAPESYSLGIAVENARSPVAVRLAATELHHFCTKLTPVLFGGVPDGDGEAVEHVSAYVARSSSGYPIAAHLSFDSHLRFPAARRLVESGLESRTGLFPTQYTSDASLSAISTLDPVSAQITRINLSAGGIIQDLIERPRNFSSYLTTFSKTPVSGESSQRLSGVLERIE